MKTRFLYLSVLSILLSLTLMRCAFSKESLADGRIIFRSNRDGNYDLFVMRLDDSLPQKLVNFPGRTSIPNDNNGFIPSPDGNQVAFTSDRDGDFEIYTINVESGDLSNLTNNTANDTSFAWSPDGKQIAIVSDRDAVPLNTAYDLMTNNIYIVDINSAEVHRLTAYNNVNQYGELSWSPDGEKLVFSMSSLSPYGPTVSGIYSVNLTNSSITSLASHSDLVLANPKWAPNGKQIMYSVMGSMLSNVSVVNSDGSDQVPLTDKSLGFVISALWSPDGKHILLSSKKDGEYYIHTIEPTGKGLITLSKNRSNYDTSPSWSPDGKHIIFSSKQTDGKYHLYIMNADGTNQMRLTNGPGEETSPIWLPMP